jgi:hypothetical protein
MTKKQQAQVAYVELLMDKVRSDNYPSATHLQMIEESLPREMVPGYVDMLIDKARQDHIPSVPMLQRIQRVTNQML